MSFGKHRTFYIRQGWLPKGLHIIVDNPYIFTPANREEAIDKLGIGKTMVASLRFWMEATGLTDEGRGNSGMIEHKITDLGEFILENDPYFEDIKTLWLIHYKLTTREELATTWYWFFNYYEDQFVDQTSFMGKLDNYIQKHLDKELAQSSLKKEFLCFKNTYLYQRNYSHSQHPEDILTSPLSDLKLMTTKDNNSFQIYKPMEDDLASEVIYYVILDQYSVESGEQIALIDLLKPNNSIGRIFRLERNQLLKHLEYLEKKEYIELHRGFGHNHVTLLDTDKFKILATVYNQTKFEGIRHG